MDSKSAWGLHLLTLGIVVAIYAKQIGEPPIQFGAGLLVLVGALMLVAAIPDMVNEWWAAEHVRTDPAAEEADS